MRLLPKQGQASPPVSVLAACFDTTQTAGRTLFMASFFPAAEPGFSYVFSAAVRLRKINYLISLTPDSLPSQEDLPARIA